MFEKQTLILIRDFGALKIKSKTFPKKLIRGNQPQRFYKTTTENCPTMVSTWE
jgi:hypothetical protein